MLANTPGLVRHARRETGMGTTGHQTLGSDVDHFLLFLPLRPSHSSPRSSGRKRGTNLDTRCGLVTKIGACHQYRPYFPAMMDHI